MPVVQAAIAASARELGLWIVAGTLPLTVPGDTRPANACLVFDAAGQRVARYDKIHLFDVDLPGRREGLPRIRERPPGYGTGGRGHAGRPARPERVLRSALPSCIAVWCRGSELFSVPAAFTGPTGRAHWEILLRARAVETSDS